MSEYKTIETSREVFAVLRAAHPEMIVFGSYSAPEGDKDGDPTRSRVFTSFGFRGHAYPIVEALTVWDYYPETPLERANERSNFWLCLPPDGD